MANQRTLLIGGMGFIGLHTARAFLDAGQDVIVTYHQNRREPDFLARDLGTRALVEQLDVTNARQVEDIVGKHQPEGIVYLAVPALAGVSPADEFKTNTQGYLNVLDAARQASVRRVTVTSSLAIYSNVKRAPWTEDMDLPVNSSNPTEAYKKALEVLGLFFGQRTSMDIIFLRVAGIFGPLYHSMANLPSRLCHAAVKGVSPDLSTMRGGPPKAGDGRDHTYVKDCARGIQMAHLAPNLQHRVYNLGNGRATTPAEIVAAIQKQVPDFTAELQPGGSESPTYMDLSRATQGFGYQPKYGVERGVAEYLEWLRTHPQ
jgi:UDP-glucose 4-epimerase